MNEADATAAAAKAMDEAIESALAGHPAYPAGATFVSAEDPALGQAIRLAIDEGGPVVVANPDGSTRILRAESFPATP